MSIIRSTILGTARGNYIGTGGGSGSVLVTWYEADDTAHSTNVRWLEADGTVHMTSAQWLEADGTAHTWS